MKQSMENKSDSKISSGLIIVIVAVAAVIIVVTIAVVAVMFLQREQANSSMSTSASNQFSLGYAAEAKVMLDKNELQEAMDQAMENARNGNIGLKYKNNAYSTDGINFECYIANSSSNIYDMFLTIFADLEMKDQIFLSGLVPPGSGFESITLDHELGLGDHTVYVALTQVDTDENGDQVIVRQVVHTMEFHVGKQS